MYQNLLGINAKRNDASMLAEDGRLNADVNDLFFFLDFEVTICLSGIDEVVVPAVRLRDGFKFATDASVSIGFSIVRLRLFRAISFTSKINASREFRNGRGLKQQ